MNSEMTLDNWYDWDFFILISIMEEFAINWLDLDERGCLRPTCMVFNKRRHLRPIGLILMKGCLRSTGLILTKGSVCDQLAWSWRKEASVINWLDLDKKERLWSTSLILTKGCLWSTGFILTKRTSATNW